MEQPSERVAPSRPSRQPPAGALVLSTAVAVTVGAQMGSTVSARVLKTVAGIGFVLIGLWTLLDRS